MKQRRVGILVRRDIESPSTGRLDLIEKPAYGSPVVAAPYLQVKEVYGNPRLLGHANREVDLLFMLEALASMVRGIIITGKPPALPG